MRMFSALLFLLIAIVANADGVLVLDFNDAKGERMACYNQDPGKVWTVNNKNNKTGVIGAAEVRRTIAAMDAQGMCPDQVVLSGHHGPSGEVFGGDKNQNGMYAKEFEEILNDYPRVRDCIKGIAIWGCYGGTVHAAQKHWVKPIKSSMYSIAFPLQSRVKEDKESQKLLGEVCKPETRARAAQAVASGNRDAICRLYESIPGLAKLNGSVATCDYMASKLYGNNVCYTTEQLYARCAEFDVTGAQLDQFNCYMNGDPGCENPPTDGTDVLAVTGEAPSGKKGPLRKYYNDLHMWFHCHEQLKTNHGYEMPDPGQVIRLVKFNQIKANLQALNGAEIASYDAVLKDIGLGNYTLGNISKMPRSEIKSKIDTAFRAIDAALRSGQTMAGGRDLRAAWTMAKGMQSTLVELTPYNSAVVNGRTRYNTCSSFALVNYGNHPANNKSQCMVDYNTALQMVNAR